MAPVNPYAAWWAAAHREWAALLATDPAEQVEMERRWQQHLAEQRSRHPCATAAVVTVWADTADTADNGRHQN